MYTFLPVKVFRTTDGDQAVSVSEFGKHSNFVTIFELNANSHFGAQV